MRIGSLFSGFGGLDLAVEAVTGATPAWFCEFDPAPSKVLAHHWPDVPNHKDVTRIDWAEVEPVDILTGGSPCQDLSHAGKRAGMTEGTRSNLWVNMREAINHLRPQLVVWENVLGALSAQAESESDATTSNLEPGGDYWQRPEVDIFGHSVAYSETLPKSGTTRNGQLYERPISAHPTTGQGSSSSHGPALPTPMASPSGNTPEEHLRKKPGRKVVTDLAILVENDLLKTGGMLPTPKATDGVFGRPKTTGRPIEKAQHLQTIVTLLPTPAASDHSRNDSPADQKRNSPGLTTVSVHFPTPNARDGNGGGAQHPRIRKAGGHQVCLTDAVLELSGDDTPPLFGVGNK